MSVILKILSVLGFLTSAICFLESEVEACFFVLIFAIVMLSAGVLFKNLGETFEDINMIRRRQRLDLLSRGVLKEEE